MPEASQRQWTPEEDAVLRRMREAGMPQASVAVALGRTVSACQSRWHELSRRSLPARRGDPWREDEDAVLRRMVSAGAKWAAIADSLPGRTPRGCEHRASALGLGRAAGRARAGGRKAPSRRCHDCGRPTPDYRCPECRARWRIEHGVPAGGAEDEESCAVFGARCVFD